MWSSRPKTGAEADSDLGGRGKVRRRSRRTIRYMLTGWYPVGTNPQHPMNTVSTFRQGLERFHGFLQARGGRDPKEITLAYRVLSGPRRASTREHRGARPKLFTGGDSDWVGDIRRLQGTLGVTSVDVAAVRFYGEGGRPCRARSTTCIASATGVLSRLA